LEKEKDSDKQSPVFEAKHKRSLLVRVLEDIIAIACTIILWFFIVITLYNKLYVNANDNQTNFFIIMALVCVAVVVIMVIWQFYNWFLFHDKKRRKEFPQQSLAEVGELYGISKDNMERLQKIRNVAVVEFRNHRYYYCIDGETPIEIGMLRKK
jgi:poly-beta-1,6-N-acetyl-D-glucosamine biosynthesis protein PgaD